MSATTTITPSTWGKVSVAATAFKKTQSGQWYCSLTSPVCLTEGVHEGLPTVFGLEAPFKDSANYSFTFTNMEAPTIQMIREAIALVRESMTAQLDSWFMKDASMSPETRREVFLAQFRSPLVYDQYGRVNVKVQVPTPNLILARNADGEVVQSMAPIHGFATSDTATTLCATVAVNGYKTVGFGASLKLQGAFIVSEIPRPAVTVDPASVLPGL